ncbi:S8 family serine peptidase [Haloplanus rubicundus]|uniref:Subtilase protease n=1 Tax=Haloplanus rubicundus TaxID=1547898 RepID=A0A345EG81_9EURY|nr:S8 family serine peptidase [Haloplanus rubicundus]AXG11203.1 subtilase protease [Haloplanus rubicundus]
MPPRSRVALLTVVVVLAAVQPTLAGTAPTDGSRSVGDVGPTVGAAIERHPSGAGATADALRSVRADTVHERGHTGTGVSVGVIGQGFETEDALEPHTAGWRQVGDGPRSTAHDTAVAEVVSETAPDANLYLAGVGRTPTPAEYAAAVEWLTARGVDIIVDSGSYFPSVAADERRITAAAERASDRGVVFVTSAGNYANRHWAGPGTAEGWVAFDDGDAANALADGQRLRGRVTVRLRWRSAADYDLYLYRRLPNGDDPVVAKSVADEASPGPSIEGIDVAVPAGRYYVAVYADDGVTDPDRVQVFAARHELEHTTARGSMLAPATSDRVVAVGAAADGERLDYSSLSATGAVDLTAPADARTRADPDLTGTSAAAPYVAGTAALVTAAGGDPSPARVESILERTAAGEGETVDALAAVEAATAAGAGPAAVSDASDGGSAGPTISTDGTATLVDVSTGPEDDERRVTDATTDATGADSVDRAARNVTRPAGDGERADEERRTDEGRDGTARDDARENGADERNGDAGADRNTERDGRDRGTESTDGERRDDTSDRRDGAR